MDRRLRTQHKILKLSTIKSKLRSAKEQGYTIAFTNGCFDILHAGHVRYLEAIKHNKNILVIGLNSDKSIRKIKGTQRPIIPQNDRAELLAALNCVDYVVLFDEPTPLKLITALKPDILAKGEDWRGKTVAGEELVKSYGGKVRFITFLKGRSTSQIIQTILKKCRP